jgi:CBS domain-containing protein
MADDRRRGRALTVGEMMQTRVVYTTPDSPMSEAAAEMVRERVGSALVVDGPLLAGILTERDILRAAASATDLTRVRVSAWMTKDPQSAEPGTTIEDAAQMMLLNGFRHLPIMEGRTVRGVVSLRDLAAARMSRPAHPRHPRAS